MRHAELKPELPSSMFPIPQSRVQEQFQGHLPNTSETNVNIPNYERENSKKSSLDHSCADEFLDEIDDRDLVEVGKGALLSYCG